jgi:hypothetical protein
MTLDPDIATWTLLGTWVLVIGTILLMWWQTRVSRILNSANAVLALRERFDGTQLRQARRRLAEQLLNGHHDDVTNLEIGAFFELIATLTRNKVLDEELIWEAFGTWVAGYYHALRSPVDLIGRARTNLQDPLIFHEFEWLTERIAALDRKKMGTHHQSTATPQEDAVALLKREAALDG